MEKDKTDNIEKARQVFLRKEFAESIEIYNTIPPHLLNDLDRGIIEHCKKYLHLKKRP